MEERPGIGGATRGYCRICGSSLYTREEGAFRVAVDGETGGRQARHICTGQKAGYYDLDDGLPRSEGHQ